MSYSGSNPNGTVAAARTGIKCFASGSGEEYICTETDQSGNPSGTTWELYSEFVAGAASIEEAGIVALATQLEAEQIFANSSSDASGTVALTPLSLYGIVANAGNNTNITQLSGLTEPITQEQGGTGTTGLLDGIQNVVPLTAGFNLGSLDGETLSDLSPNRYRSVSFVTANTNLQIGNLYILTTDDVTLNTPAVGSNTNMVIDFYVGNVSAVVLSSAGTDGAEIEGAGNSFTFNCPNAGFIRFTYTGSLKGWSCGAFSNTLSGLLGASTATLYTELGTAQGDISTLDTNMSTAQGNISTLQGQMSTADTNISTLQGQMSTADTNISTMQGQITALEAEVAGGVAIANKSANFNAAAQTIYTISLSSASNNITATMPDATICSGQVIGFKVITVSSSNYTLTINPTGSQTLEGQASLTMQNQYQYYEFFSDGTNWWIRNYLAY